MDKNTLELLKNKIEQLENIKKVNTKYVTPENLNISSLSNDLNINKLKNKLKNMDKKQLQDAIRIVSKQLNINESDVKNMLSL